VPDKRQGKAVRKIEVGVQMEKGICVKPADRHEKAFILNVMMTEIGEKNDDF
jgi:hypothetical protein